MENILILKELRSLIEKIDSNCIVASSAVTIGILAAYSAYRVSKETNRNALLSKSDNVYESKKSVNEYLIFHYGSHDDILKWNFGPKDSFDFPSKCAELCCKFVNEHESHSQDFTPLRALDIGCAVGRSSFDMCSYFDEVYGIDYSQAFVDVCNEIKDKGRLQYDMQLVGDITEKLEAVVDPNINRQRAIFRQGDACNLPSSSRLGGRFHCVLAANLICRLHTPAKFLADMERYIVPGGILVITSPYSFSTEFTPKQNWIGGFQAENGNEVTGFIGLKRHLERNFDLVHEENIPFLIRETERKHQYTIAHATVWRRQN